MTNKTAILILRNLKPKDSESIANIYHTGKALSMAVKALEKLDQIENIVEAYKTDNPKEPYYDTEDYMNNIVEVLEDGQKDSD